MAQTAWQKALFAAALVAVDPRGLGGILVKARAGPVRDGWLEALAAAFGLGVPSQRIAATSAEDQLTGGLDLGLTLQSGRPSVRRGVLAIADGGILVLAMAERATPATAAIIAAAVDDGEVRIERDGASARHPARFTLIALDEGIDERLPPSLADRLGLQVGLDDISWRALEAPAASPSCADILAARALLPAVTCSPETTEALCALALAYGGGSIRQSLHLLRAARAAAALRGRMAVELEDAEIALWLVLGLPMAEQASPSAADDQGAMSPECCEPEVPQAQANSEVPAAEAALGNERLSSPPQQVSCAPDDSKSDASPESLQDMLVAAVAAQLPPGFLAALAAKNSAGRQGEAGRSGVLRHGGVRGRGIGIVARPPTAVARLDVLATLRQAVPWQKLRTLPATASSGTVHPLKIRKADFRYRRRCEKAGTTTIFVVDASGSAAVERLAETKGAIELLLAGCYVRRDSVALIAFRGREASLLLEPTRSLLRAKRSLSALPGGGGTPLAAGILSALDLAQAARRRGQSVMTVFLTDGRGNVALDGTSARDRVSADTARAALLFRSASLPALVIDTARRADARASALGHALGAETLVLPRGGAEAMARAVGRRLDG